MGWLRQLISRATEAITHLAGTVREMLQRGFTVEKAAEEVAVQIQVAMPGPQGMRSNYQYVLEYDLRNPLTGERWVEYRSIPSNEPMTWEEATEMGYNIIETSKPVTDYIVKDIHPSKLLINPKLV
jgi:hypothetical protein